MIKIVFVLIIFLFIFLIAFNAWSLKFHPTRYWFIRILQLYRFFPYKYHNIRDIDVTEVEEMLRYLIESRCADENRIIGEVRNGYDLYYFPEGVERNKRVWEFAYIEIVDDSNNLVTRVGFDANGRAKYQIRSNEMFCEKNRILGIKNYSKFIIREIM